MTDQYVNSLVLHGRGRGALVAALSQYATMRGDRTPPTPPREDERSAADLEADLAASGNPWRELADEVNVNDRTPLTPTVIGVLDQMIHDTAWRMPTVDLEPVIDVVEAIGCGAASATAEHGQQTVWTDRAWLKTNLLGDPTRYETRFVAPDEERAPWRHFPVVTDDREVAMQNHALIAALILHDNRRSGRPSELTADPDAHRCYYDDLAPWAPDSGRAENPHLSAPPWAASPGAPTKPDIRSNDHLVEDYHHLLDAVEARDIAALSALGFPTAGVNHGDRASGLGTVAARRASLHAPRSRSDRDR